MKKHAEQEPRLPVRFCGEIMEMTARHFGRSVAELQGRNRTEAVTWPRQVGMYLCRTFTDAGFEDVGAAFCRDHSTALHAMGVVKARRETRSGDDRDVLCLEAAVRQVLVQRLTVYVGAVANGETDRRVKGLLTVV